MNKKISKHRAVKHLAITFLTVLLALLMTGFAFAKTGTDSNSSDRNGHMSWDEFFSAWTSGEYEEEADEGGQETPANSIETNAVDTLSGGSNEAVQVQTEAQTEALVTEDGLYTSKEEVAAYLNLFGHLPDNYITKKEARKLGWDSSAGNLNIVAPGKSIGGDYFGNYEGSLPEAKDRDYYECDIDYEGGYRGAKRIIFSNDGLIYYTEDHYNTFELLYGEE